MQKRGNHIFYSKVLLFGEYSIILNSMGLTIPFSHFSGKLAFINKNGYTDIQKAKESNAHLQLFLKLLSQLKHPLFMEANLNIHQLETDIEQGLFFESTIPQGYGLGSSGALVAAIYTAYSRNIIQSKAGLSQVKLQELKLLFSQIESFFHGTSSGIDPLICYMKHPLVLKDSNGIESTGIPRKNIAKNDAIFLIDTKQTSKTEPLVESFLNKCTINSFKKQIEQTLIPKTNLCIKHLLKGEISKMFEELYHLSLFQLQNFTEMIPEKFKPLWEEGIQTKKYLLKLCGSGGGGFLLGFTRNFPEVEKLFAQKGFEIFPVYQEL